MAICLVRKNGEVELAGIDQLKYRLVYTDVDSSPIGDPQA